MLPSRTNRMVYSTVPIPLTCDTFLGNPPPPRFPPCMDEFVRYMQCVRFEPADECTRQYRTLLDCIELYRR